MKLTKRLRLPSGTEVPAGTELHFSQEGRGFFHGEEIERAKIPLQALECIIVGGIFDGQALLAKNRDRMYTPRVGIRHTVKSETEIAYIYDLDTDWREGINSRGLCIANSALQVGFDEKEKKIVSATGKKSHDGKIIVKALQAENIDEAVAVLTSYKGGVRGHTIVTDGKVFKTIESTSKHEHIVSDKPGTKPIVRTNHGYDYTDAGYTSGKAFVSSIVRRQQVLDNLDNDQDVLTALSTSKYGPNDAKNVIRNTRTMQTTSQMVLNSKTKTLTFKPLPGKCEFTGVKTELPEGWKPKINIELL